MRLCYLSLASTGGLAPALAYLSALPGSRPFLAILLHQAQAYGQSSAIDSSRCLFPYPKRRPRLGCRTSEVVQAARVAVSSVLQCSRDPARSRAAEDPSEHSPSTPSDPENPGNPRPANFGGGEASGVDSKAESNSWSEKGGHDRQCPGPQDHQREGEPDPMSQRRSVPGPTSRRSSNSPPVAGFASPQSSQPATQRSHAHRDDQQDRTQGPRDRFVSEDGGPQHPANPTPPVVRNILNPAEQPQPYGGTMPPISRPPTAGGTPPGYTQRAYGTNSPTHPYPPFQGQQPNIVPQATYSHLPPTSTPSGAPPIHDRSSPTTGHSYSPVGSARRILTPQSPRASSLSRAALMGGNSPKPPLPPHMVLHGGGVYPETGARGGPPRPGGPTPLQSLTQGSYDASPTTTPPPSRAISQSMIGYGLPPGPQQDQQQPTTRPMRSSGPPFTTSLPPGRSLSTSGPVSDGRWAASFLGQMAPGIAGARPTSIDGPHLLTITPPYGEEIVVPVDVHQASKQSDEKRQRNAGASARFRQRKKEREREQQAGLHKLEAANRELEKRARDLEMERDYYRAERNRLRDIVAQTPGISEWADRGPPSPVSSRSQGYTTEGSPMTGPSHPHPPVASYVATDPAMLERPARRRRTDPEPQPQFTTPTYAPPQPSTLPPIPPPAYGTNPTTHGQSPAGLARLPPLRLDQPSVSGPPPGPGAPAPPPLPPHTQPGYPPYGRPPYEPGWPTPQRRSHDGSQR